MRNATPLDSLEMHELLRLIYPEHIRSDDDEYYDLSSEVADECMVSLGDGVEVPLAELLARVVMLTVPMKSEFTGRLVHCIGVAGVIEGATYMTAVVKRDFEQRDMQMTSTAHEDQFTPATQTILRIRAPYDPISILRRNDEEFAAQQAATAPSVPDGCAIISRTLTPEAWKRLCNADIWPVTPKSFQRMLDVLMEVAMMQSAMQAPAVPASVWRDIVVEMMNWWDDQHMTLAQGRAIRDKARALLQSAEVRHD